MIFFILDLAVFILGILLYTCNRKYLFVSYIALFYISIKYCFSHSLGTIAFLLQKLGSHSCQWSVPIQTPLNIWQ